MCSAYENHTVTAGLDEQLSGFTAKMNHVIHTEWHRQPVKNNTNVNTGGHGNTDIGYLHEKYTL